MLTKQNKVEEGTLSDIKTYYYRYIDQCDISEGMDRLPYQQNGIRNLEIGPHKFSTPFVDKGTKGNSMGDGGAV